MVIRFGRRFLNLAAVESFSFRRTQRGDYLVLVYGGGCVPIPHGTEAFDEAVRMLRPNLFPGEIEAEFVC